MSRPPQQPIPPVPPQWVQQPRQQRTPPGRPWWTVTAVCHALHAVIFAGAVWACIHWINRSGTPEYHAQHRGADPDGMMLAQLVALGVAAAAALGVVYAVVGVCVTLGRYQSGPVMLLLAFPAAGITAMIAPVELFRGHDTAGGSVMMAIIAIVVVGTLAAAMAVGKPQRPKRSAQIMPPPPAPYQGGSPYLRPPGN